MELTSMRLWEEYQTNECFAMELPGEECPVMAVILGSGGEEYGVMMTRGAEAYDMIHAFFEKGRWASDLRGLLNMMAVSLEPLSNIPPEYRKFLHRAGAPDDPDAVVPFFMAEEREGELRELTRQEVRTMLYALRGILTAHENGILEPDVLWESEEVQTLIVRGEDPLEPRVVSEWRRFERSWPGAEEPISVPPQDLWDLPQDDTHLLVGFCRVPSDPLWADLDARMLIVMDESSEDLVMTEILCAEDLPEASELLFGVFRGRRADAAAGIPSKITFTSETLQALLGPSLEALGVESVLVERHPAVEATFDSFCGFWGLNSEERWPGDEALSILASHLAADLADALVSESEDDSEGDESLAELLELIGFVDGLVGERGEEPEDEDDLIEGQGEESDEVTVELPVLETEQPDGIIDFATGAVPADDDVEKWNEWDVELTWRGVQHYNEEGYSRRAVIRYFGDEQTGLDWLVGYADEAIVHCYAEWFWMDYRPTRRSKTHAEKLLEKDLPQPERKLLEARIQSHATIHRIAEKLDAETVVLEDVLVGGELTVHCPALVREAEEDMFFCSRAYAAGNYNLLALCGPKIAHARMFEALDYLEDEGMEYTPEGLRRDAHLLGHLWGLFFTPGVDR